MTGPDGLVVREATVPELPDVLNVLDGGALATDAGRIRRALDSGGVLVAVAGEDGASGGNPADGRVLGALVLVGDRITAVAVRRRRRDQGVGTALVASAVERRERLVAEFDPGVRPFWESLGFDIRPLGDGRYRGRR